MLKPGQPIKFIGSDKLITNPNIKDNFPAHLCPPAHLTIDPIPNSPQMNEQYPHYFNQKMIKKKDKRKRDDNYHQFLSP